MNYPEEMVRGLSNKDTIEDDNTVLSAAFQFTEIAGRQELSINWKDDEGAIDVAMNQKKKNSEDFQFKVGVAILSRRKIDDIKFLTYERAPIPENHYHGNLFYNDLSQGKKRLLSGMLSMAVVKVIRREDCVKEK